MTFLALTIPYAPGDRVECRLGGQVLDGVGTVTDISFDLADGGTPVYPSFKVVLDEKASPEVPDEGFYTEICLTRLKKVSAE